MPDRKKVIKAVDICLGHGKCNDCSYRSGANYSDQNCRGRMLQDVLVLLKEQDELLRKLQKDKDKLCLDVSKWKHRFHERPLKEKEAVKPVRDTETGRIWLCGNCGTYVGFEDSDPHDPNEFDKYCRDCGTPVLWERR